MDSKPVDLIDLQRVAAKEGQDRALKANLDSLQLVTFVRNPEPGKSDPVGKHPSNGRPVFPDKRRGGTEIKAGETWFCELEEYRPGFGPQIYYGSPIVKIDASYLFDIRPDQVDRLVEALQKTSQATLLDAARKKLQDELEKAAQTRVDTAAMERDTARREADGLRAELDRLREANVVLKRESDGLKAKQEVNDSPAGGEATGQSGPGELGVPQSWSLLGDGAGSLVLQRPLATVIESAILRDGRYFVHVSPDRGVLLIRWHPEGNLVAVGHKITIPGLEVLRPFDKPEALRGTYDSRAGGVRVDLKGM